MGIEKDPLMALAVGRGKLTKGESTWPEHNSETFTAAGGRAFLSTQGPTSLGQASGKFLGYATTREATRQQKRKPMPPEKYL